MAIESKMPRAPLARPAFGGESPPQKKKPVWIIWLLIALLFIGGGWYLFSRSSQKDVLSELGSSGSGPAIASGEYQAVFLDNGQTYFGKLDHTSSDFYTLTDVFYLQTGATTATPSGSIALQKLGFEAHGPTDKMQINRSHILFVEDMKADSKVIQAIKQYKSGK